MRRLASRRCRAWVTGWFPRPDSNPATKKTSPGGEVFLVASNPGSALKSPAAVAAYDLALGLGAALARSLDRVHQSREVHRFCQYRRGLSSTLLGQSFG